MSFCGYCGVPRLADARFCGECGGDLDELDRDIAEFNELQSNSAADGSTAEADASLDPNEGISPRVNAQDGLACSACGANNEPDDRFCSECGSTLEAADKSVYEVFAQRPDVETQSIEPTVAAEDEPEPKPPTTSAQDHDTPFAPDNQQAFIPDPLSNSAPSQGSHVPPATAVSGVASPIAAEDEWVEADPVPNKRRSKALVAATLLVLSSAAGAGAYWKGYVGDRPQIVASQLQDNLSGAGYSDVTVTGVPGMTMTLGGFISDKTDYEVVLQLARSFPGVGNIVSNMKVREPVSDLLQLVNQFIARDMGEPAAFVEKSPGGKISIRGTVSPAADREAILAAIKQRFGLRIDSDQTSDGPGTASQMMADSAPLPNAGAANRIRLDPAQRGSVSDPRPSRSTGDREARPPSVDVQTVSCLLPSAEEVRLTLSECRNRNGLVQ